VLLADRRIVTEGRVAVAVGPGQGDGVVAELDMQTAQVFRVEDGSVDAAIALGKRLRADAYEAVAGIGGGKIIDVTKFAAHMAGIPMVAVATNLAHDGIASPVSSLEHESARAPTGSSRRSPWSSTWTGSGPGRRAWSGPGSATW